MVRSQQQEGWSMSGSSAHVEHGLAPLEHWAVQQTLPFADDFVSLSELADSEPERESGHRCCCCYRLPFVPRA